VIDRFFPEGAGRLSFISLGKIEVNPMWSCPKCKRVFSRRNQRHACGTGNRAEVIRGRPESLVQLLSAIEEFARSLGPIEVVTREGYVLLRSTAIFVEVAMMSDAVRIAIHLRQ